MLFISYFSYVYCVFALNVTGASTSGLFIYCTVYSKDDNKVYFDTKI